MAFFSGRASTMARSDQAMIRDRPRPVNLFLRIAAALAGVNADRLAECPKDDRIATVRLALATLCAFLFATTAYSAALVLALGPETPIEIVIFAAALLAATIILVDHAVVQAHWAMAGLNDARRRGFEPEGPPAGAVGRFTMAVIRLAFSGAVAMCIAVFLVLLIFRVDIAQQIDGNHRRDNQAVVARAQQRIDGEFARVERDIAAGETRLRNARDRLDALRSKHDALATGRAALRAERIVALERRREERLEEAGKARRDASAEEHGIRQNPGNSGLAGRGSRFRNASDLARMAEDEVRRIEADIAALREEERRETVNPEVTRASEEAEALSAGLATLVARRASMVAGRDEAIQAAMRADPAYVAKREGLVARLVALEQLKAEPAVWWLIWGWKAVLMLAEMSAVLVKLLFGGGSIYGVKTALAFERSVAEDVATSEDGIAVATERLAATRENRDATRERRDRSRQDRRASRHARDRLMMSLLGPDGEPRRSA